MPEDLPDRMPDKIMELNAMVGITRFQFLGILETLGTPAGQAMKTTALIVGG